MTDPIFKCKVCGGDTELAAPDGETYCQEHCPDHDYQTDSLSDWAMCVNCLKPAPEDFYREDGLEPHDTTLNH